VQLHAFLTLPLVGGVWSTSRPGCSTPKLEQGYSCNMRMVGAGLGTLEKRKISYLFRDSKLGPLSPLTSRYAD
jgi:hypothetical protein